MLNKKIAFVNGKVLTMDSRDSIVQAVLIEGDKIAAVGTNDYIKSLLPADGKTVDVGGRVVMPGIIDSHVHTELTVNQTLNAAQVQQPHGSNCNTLEKIFNIIKEKAAKTPKGEWITAVASNMFTQNVKEGRYPTREELDKVCPDHPLMLTCEVHVAIMNTLAIQKMDIDLERKLKPNITMGRDWQTGKPTGVFIELWSHHSLTPWSTYGNLKKSLSTGVNEIFVSKGVTSVHELPASMDGVKAWQEFRAEGTSPVRVRLYMTHPTLIDLDSFLAQGIGRDFGDDWLNMGGIKLFADGIGLHANMVPYDDLKYSQDELNELVYKVHAHGLQVWTHTTTQPALEMGLNACKYALEKKPVKDHRMRLEHSGEHLSRYCEQRHIDFFKKYNIMPMATPQFMYVFPDHHTQYKTHMNNGFRMFYNSDATGSQPEGHNPWHGIWSLVVRRNMLGVVHRPEECLTPMQALRMATIDAAYAGFEDKVKGSLEPGKLADLIILGDDPLTCDPEALREMPVEMVIIGGKSMNSSSAFEGAL